MIARLGAVILLGFVASWPLAAPAEAQTAAQTLAPDLEVAISAAAEADRQDRQRRGAFARSLGDTAGARRIEAGEDGSLSGQLGQVLVQALAARADQAAAIVATALRAAPESLNAVVTTVVTYFPGHADMARGLAARIPAAPRLAPAPPQMAAPSPAVALAPVPEVQPLGAPRPSTLAGAPRPSTLAGAPRAPAPQPAKPAADDDADLDDFVPAGPAAAQIDDPWEGFNRAMFAVNDGLDRAVLRPVASGYGMVTPDPVKRALRSAFDNLKEPVRFANELLQGEFTAARTTAERFFFNSTIGFAGLFDHASDLGLKRRPADFGQTLNAYGVKSGPYLVLPLLGPSTVRDAIGSGVDILFNPMTYVAGTVEGLAVRAGSAISTRESLIEPIDDLRANSVDFYAAVRSIWAQDRARDLARDRPK